MLTLAWLGVMQRRRDVDVEFWSSACTGRLGAFAFSVVRALRGANVVQPATTHRAASRSHPTCLPACGRRSTTVPPRSC